VSEPQVKRALGRGLDALLPVPAERAPAGFGDKAVFACPIERIVPLKGQPRQHFDDASLEELAQSIREVGLIEPLVVRKLAGSGSDPILGDKYELIAGERRWRAAQKAGLRELLVVVKDVTPAAAFELAIVENIQRADLNPIELAEGYARLIKDHGYTQEKLADRVGKDRTTIANALRLLRLPANVREKVVHGELSEGHARALLAVPSDDELEKIADKVIRGRLSVRATEKLAKAAKLKAGKGADASGPQPAQTQESKSASVRDLEKRLTHALGTRVEVRDAAGRGEVAIQYANLDQLDGLLERLFKA
jgi:ParB family chromosome partitioning protein